MINCLFLILVSGCQSINEEPGSVVVQVHVHLIEINHSRKFANPQIILWDFRRVGKRLLHVDRGWDWYQPLETGPFRIEDQDVFIIKKWGKVYGITADGIIETHTIHDPEIDDRDLVQYIWSQ